MKQNLYDIFDHLNADQQELPSLKEMPVNEKSLTDRVMRKADIKPVMKKHRSYRMVGIAAAVAVLAGGTITAGAVSGKMDEFFSAVSKAGINDMNSEYKLPAVNMEISDAIDQMQSYYSCPDVSFTQTDSGTVELMGLYNDHSSLMMSFRLIVTDGTILSDDAYMLPYFTVTNQNGTVKELPEGGYLSEPFRKCDDAENVYYFTYYITDQELAGKTLHIDFAGIYTMSQQQSVMEKMHELDDELRKQHYTEEMDAGEWKKYQHENDFDLIRTQVMREAFAEETPVLKGTWSADVPIADAVSQQLTIETDSNICIIDELSVYMSEDNGTNHYSSDFNMSDEQVCGIAVFLKNGTIITDNSQIFGEEIDCQNFAYIRGTRSDESNICDGMIYCYSRPISIDEIEKISKYTNYFDENYTEHINEYPIYETVQQNFTQAR